MIVFLHGPDTFRSSRKVKEIIRQYENAHQEKVRSFYFDCKETTIDEVKRAVETISLFEAKKLVILQDVFQNVEIREWLEQSKSELHKSARHVVVAYERGEVKAKTQNKLYQWLKKHAAQQEFLLLSPPKLKLWIAREFEQYGMEISSRTQEMLARSTGSDLWRLSGEIQKIAAWEKSELTNQVKEQDVALFVDPPVEGDIFATIDAVTQRDKKRALLLMYRHIERGESLSYLFSMMIYQLRILIQIKEALERKVPYGEMTKAMKLHPFVLKKGMGVVNRFSFEELGAMYKRMFRFDYMMKTGRIEPGAALDLLVTKE